MGFPEGLQALLAHGPVAASMKGRNCWGGSTHSWGYLQHVPWFPPRQSHQLKSLFASKATWSLMMKKLAFVSLFASALLATIG